MSKFQIILLGIFAAAAVAGVALFATFRGSGQEELAAPVSIWGIAEESAIRAVLEEVRQSRDDFGQVTYRHISKDAFDREFVNALASGTGPDLILIDQSMLLAHEDKLFTIPYENYSARDFRSTFAEEGELFLTPSGILGLPISIDPLVLYYNRDIFTNEGIANPPRFWDELFILAPRVTHRGSASNITQSLVALGEYQNVLYAKDILSMLMLQAGNAIVMRDSSGAPFSVMGTTPEFGSAPAESALRFYTEFSNPIKSVYSWNRALPNSRQSFLSGDLALYNGYASEREALSRANPNLNFDMGEMPQIRDASRTMTFGTMYALAIPRASRNIAASYTVASILTSAPYAQSYAAVSGLPPARRDLLSSPPSDAYGAILFGSALRARAWLDPNPSETNRIFKNLIESTISGRALLNEAIGTADQELQVILGR